MRGPMPVGVGDGGLDQRWAQDVDLQLRAGNLHRVVSQRADQHDGRRWLESWLTLLLRTAGWSSLRKVSRVRLCCDQYLKRRSCLTTSVLEAPISMDLL